MRHIHRYENDIKKLKGDKEQLINRLNELSKAVASMLDYIEELEQLLREKDKIIDIMTKKIQVKQLGSSRLVFAVPKGDTLDQMLSNYLNQANCLVPIRKLGDGFYLFGTKKIYAKIMNGKLVIRVGGGYMIVEEFIATYENAEMLKIAKMSDEQLAKLAHGTTEANIQLNPGAILTDYRSITAHKSPTGRSSFTNALSATKRNKSMSGRNGSQ
jgi:prefoldin subunit 5